MTILAWKNWSSTCSRLRRSLWRLVPGHNSHGSGHRPISLPQMEHRFWAVAASGDRRCSKAVTHRKWKRIYRRFRLVCEYMVSTVIIVSGCFYWYKNFFSVWLKMKFKDPNTINSWSIRSFGKAMLPTWTWLCMSMELLIKWQTTSGLPSTTPLTN